jgi:hypothetical protein
MENNLKTVKNIEKEIIVETDYKNYVYEMTVQEFNNDKINILLDFPLKMYDDIKNNEFKLITSDKSSIEQIDQHMALNGLKKGNYKLMLNNSLLVKFGIK